MTPVGAHDSRTALGPTSSAVTTPQSWFQRIVIVAVVGVCLRVIFAFGVLPAMPQEEDGPYYSLQALRMLDGSIGYFYMPPGTSFLAVPVYAVFGQSTGIDHLLGVLLTSGFLLSGIWFSSVVLGWGKATFIAALLLASYPHSVMSATQLNSEPLTAIFLACAAGLVIRNVRRWSWVRWFGVALCLAGAMLTRPGSLAVLAVIAAGGVLLWKRRRISSAVILGATATLTVVFAAAAYPVLSHNAQMGQGWSISTNNEWNLFLGNTPHTPDYKTGHFGQREFDQLTPEAGAYLSSFLPQKDPSLATRDQRRAMQEAAVDYMSQHPGKTLYRVSNRARAFWGIDYTAARGIQDAYGLSNAASLPLVVMEGAGYLLVIALALTAPFVVPVRSRAYWTLIVGFVVAIMLPYLLAFALPKYHLPAIPLLMPIAALAWLSIADNPRTSWARLRRSVLWWSAMVLICAIQIELIVRLILLR